MKARGWILAAASVAAVTALAWGLPAASSPPGAPGAADSLEAARGSALFRQRGCAGCHTVGAGTRVGPDLAGVAERRSPEWIVAMVTRPDSMLAVDPVARELHERYGATMPVLGVAPVEARALHAFLAAAPAAPPEAADEAAPRGGMRHRHGRGMHPGPACPACPACPGSGPGARSGR